MTVSSTNVINYIVIAALVVWVLTRQLQARPVVVRKLFILPIVLAVIGAESLNGAVSKGSGHLTGTDITFLAIDLAVTVLFGVARGFSVRLYAQDSVLWRKGTWITLAAWILSFAARALIGVVASDHGANVVASSALMLSFGVSLAVQGAVIYWRGLQAGVPFAADQRRARAW
jgi:hypothetical protein